MCEVDWQSVEEYCSWVDYFLYGSDIILKFKKDWSWILVVDLFVWFYVFLGKY